MILPGMGVISEMIACLLAAEDFLGTSFVAGSSLGIAIIGFFVWGHHLFVAVASPSMLGWRLLDHHVSRGGSLRD